MLAQIRVQNIALMDEVTVDLEEQLNILTGETGAGKSILLGAINLALGGRSSKDILRDPEKPAAVELFFVEKNPKVLEKIQELGIEAEDGEILISRRFGTNGKGICRVNGETVVAAQVKQIATWLIDIHGQHEHQSLLNSVRHIDILDRFIPEMASLRNSMEMLWTEHNEIEKELQKYTTNEQEKERLLALMQYESNEIAEANLQESEEEALQEQRKRLMYSGRLRGDSMLAYEVLRSATAETCAVDLISTALNKIEGMERLDGEFFGARRESLQDALSVVEDVAADLRAYVEDIDEDDGRLDQIEERLDLIHRLKNKYGRTVEEIYQYKEKNDREIEKLQNISETIATLRSRKAEKLTQMESLAARMTDLRQTQGKEISAEITEILKTLQFSDPDFWVEIEPKDLSPKGRDQVIFMIRTNIGEERKPLSKIASGGEISRIMLAIKTVLAGQDEIDTLIFDEIDTGISGRTAQSVAEKMSRIARYRQVIAVTHLPQIAAMADNHLCIEKTAQDGKTYTHINKLSDTAEIAEIARLLGGLEMTEAVYKNAQEMKKMAEGWKKKDRVI